MRIQGLLCETRRRRRRPWDRVRYFFLSVALVSFGFTGWIYLDQVMHQNEASEAFDAARQVPPAQRRQAPSQPLKARLKIPRLRMTAMVEEGVGDLVLSRGAGHIPGTALPGGPGNVGVAAHRDTLFRGLKGIRKNDRILLSTVTKDYEYVVISTRIVRPDDVSVLAPSPNQNTLTLVTCYPFSFIGHAPKRFIVRARQIG
jgi:sortase A